MNEKIAKQLQKLDSMVFRLRMAVTALQSEFHESVTVSIKEPTEQYNTTLFEASPQSRESKYGTVPLDKHDEVEVKVSHVEPDGFHGKSYKDFNKSQMKECFVCGEELKCTHPPVELWYREDDAAHSECVWNAAKVAVYGYGISITKGEDKCHLP